jgi:Holliday junction resolvase RusA-like endonuclease
MTKFEYQGKLPTLNEYILWERGNKFAAASKKKAFTFKVALIAKSQIKEKLTGCYDIELTWCVPTNKQDSDNVFFAVKFLLDGLVLAQILPNDGRKNVRNISHKIITDKTKKESVIVNLIEIQ